MRHSSRLLLTAIAVTAVMILSGCAAQTSASESIRVDAQGSFTPSGPAKAGVPLTLEFGPGGGCTAAIQFQELGIYEDLTDGGGTVSLPPLAKGEYPLYCQSMMVMGVLRVE